MNKNVIIAIVVVLVLILLGVGGYFLLNNKPEEVASINVEEASNKLANSLPFSEMATMDITTDVLETAYGINPANVTKVSGKAPLMNVQSSMYIILEAAEGKVDTVKAELDSFIDEYIALWSRYLPEQYDYVENRKVGVVGNCIYMIISENSATLEQEIIK